MKVYNKVIVNDKPRLCKYCDLSQKVYNVFLTPRLEETMCFLTESRTRNLEKLPDDCPLVQYEEAK